MSQYEATLDEVLSHLRKARRVLFITGAGISADSGLPTYRGIGGLYEGHFSEDGMAVEDALSGSTLRRSPEITWKYLLQVEESCRGARFNRGHEVIAEMQNTFDEVWVLTQNVDGFHRDAGSRHVIEIHGNLHGLICTQCDWREQVQDYGHLQAPPRCPRCAAPIRPTVIFFGEMLPQKAVQTLYRELERGFDMMFSVGTSSLFPYIAEPVAQARWRGTVTVEINPGDSLVSDMVTYRLRARAAVALHDLWERYRRAP